MFLTFNLSEEIRKRKTTKAEVVKDYVLNNKFMQKNRAQQMKFINSLRKIIVPLYHDRQTRAMELFNRCLSSNNFSLYFHLDYICQIVSKDARTLHIHSASSHPDRISKIVPFSRDELKQFDSKLLKKIEDRHSFTLRNEKVVLGLTTRLIGIQFWLLNNLFPDPQKFIYQGQTVYYAIIRKEQKINETTYRNFNTF